MARVEGLRTSICGHMIKRTPARTRLQQKRCGTPGSRDRVRVAVHNARSQEVPARRG